LELPWVFVTVAGRVSVGCSCASCVGWRNSRCRRCVDVFVGVLLGVSVGVADGVSVGFRSASGRGLCWVLVAVSVAVGSGYPLGWGR